jgi:hypothetical protein
VLIRAGVFDVEVPLHDPLRMAARWRRWMALQHQQQQQQQQRRQQQQEQGATSIGQQQQQQGGASQLLAVTGSRSLYTSAAAAAASDATASDATAGDATAAAVGGEGSTCSTGGVWLRVVPGGHSCFEGDVREAALQLAFLMNTVQ